MCAFQTTPNKDAVRQLWDIPILRAYSGAVGKRLKYFGLTGPEMLDIRTWREVLNSWTAVESRPKNAEKLADPDRVVEQMTLTAIDHDLADGLEVLRGQIEDVILRGRDNVNYRR